MKSMEKGYTLSEMLVSMLIFSSMMIGVYYFFDSGRWMYLKAEKRANMQENGRLAMEGMEREMRLISFGLPSGTEIGTRVSWLPAIFLANTSQIGFRGDVNNVNSLVTENIAAGDSVINVEWPDYVCPSPHGNPVVIVERGRNWLSYTCNSANPLAETINISAGSGAAFLREEIEIFSPLHVFYRLTPDTNNDGICDDSLLTTPDRLTNCIIQRAELADPDPQTTVADNLWQTFATNIERFQMQYYRKQADISLLSALPLAANDRALVDLIRITIQASDRSDQVQEYQSSDFTSDILIRKRRY